MAKQWVYLDESGDAGFKLGKGSSSCLVMGICIFETPEAVDLTAEAIRVYRDLIGKPKDFVFHFSGYRHKHREEFLRAVADCPFRVRAIVFPKRAVYPYSNLWGRPEEFYNFTMRLLFTHTFGSVSEVKVFIDGERHGDYAKQLRSYVRKEANKERRVISQLRFERKDNLLIQLADMVIGAVARSCISGRGRTQTYRAVIKPRIENVWTFGLPQKGSGPSD